MLRMFLEAMYEDVATHPDPKFQVLVVCQAVTVSYRPPDRVLLSWMASPSSDMVADSVAAVVLQASLGVAGMRGAVPRAVGVRSLSMTPSCCRASCGVRAVRASGLGFLVPAVTKPCGHKHGHAGEDAHGHDHDHDHSSGADGKGGVVVKKEPVPEEAHSSDETKDDATTLAVLKTGLEEHVRGCPAVAQYCCVASRARLTLVSTV